jgi:RNA polymerase sigma-70 factor (sigma-E family)
MSAERVEILLDLGEGAAATPGDDEVDVVLHTRRTRDEEFAAFMREAREPLHRMAYLLCGDRHRAEELTQQAFERTYRAWPRARTGEPIAYARRVLANLRVDSWRRTRREVLSGPDELVHDETARRNRVADGTETVDDRDAVVRALLVLPLRQRRVVVLRHLLDLSEREVAEELGMPVGTVKSTASRALARLRVELSADPTGGATP